MTQARLLIDFETFSEVSVKDVGSAVYAEHPSTEILCMSWKFTPSGERGCWIPGTEFPKAIIHHVASKGLCEAHNVQFETAIWKNLLWRAKRVRTFGREYPLPPIPMPTRWTDTMAVCAHRALPLGLDAVGNVLNLNITKMKEGKAILNKVAKPRKPTKKDPSTRLEDWGLMEQCYEYCDNDVDTEEELGDTLGDLPSAERRVWVLDQIINNRGVQIDTEAMRAALKIRDHIFEVLGKELKTLTEGRIKTGKQVAKIREWLSEQGYYIGDLQKDTVAEALAGLLRDGANEPRHKLYPAYRMLQIRQHLGSASISKLDKLAETVCLDGRVRNLLQYHGASTGRWCLTGDHEVLTPEGWERLDTWGGGEIACWRPTEAISFQRANQVSFSYTGELVHIKNLRMDQISTPDHKMPGWGLRDDVFRARRSDQRGRYYAPYTGWRTVLKKPVTEAALRALIMVQADGAYTDTGVRLHFKKRRKIERAKTLLRRAGIIFSTQTNANTTAITIARRHIPLYLQMFAPNKQFVWWLLDCDPDVVFDELEHWGAYRCGPNSIEYSTTQKQYADVLQALAHMSGRTASCVYTRSDKPGCNLVYILNIWLAPINRHEVRGPAGIFRGARGGFVYCAETPTGYFLVRRNGKVWVTGNSGRGFQPQNLPRGSDVKNKCTVSESGKVDRWMDMEVLIEHLKTCSPEEFEMLYPEPIEAIGASLRGMMIAGPGKTLNAADFAAIESRGVMWMAQQDNALKAFREYDKDPKNNPDIYCVTASHMYGQKVTKADTEMRQSGKVTILGCGYQMGPTTLKRQAEKDFGIILTDEQSEFMVGSYRDIYYKVPQLWAGLQDAATEALQTGNRQTFSYVAFETVTDAAGKWLTCILPNRRRLWYYNAEMRKMPTAWGEMRWQVTYEGRNNKRNGLWDRIGIYGGMWTENIVQALSRDLMVEAMFRIERAGYETILTVHDEIIAESDADFGGLEEFEALMKGPVPAWAPGFPVSVDGWRGPRYKKG